MNVYVRELVASLAHRGADCTVYVRRYAVDLPREVVVEPGVRVVHIDAGDVDLAKELLPGIVDEFTDGVIAHIDATGGTDVIHANYWLSGVSGHRIKHELELPLVTTFHTLARVKAETGDSEPERRIQAESDVIKCSEVITANSVAEAHQLQRLYGAPAERIEIVTPGVEHALFSPGDQQGARRALGLGRGPVLMFVGRIQPLKGVDVAVQAFAALDRPDATLLIVGGASGNEGATEVERITALMDRLGVRQQVRLVDPQPHHRLGTYYRAADVVLAPSRSESFGLVALEAAACGTPVVASAVGGLRTLVDHGHSGFLVEGRDPKVYASFVDEVLSNPLLAAEMAMNGAERARSYTWGSMADRLMGIYSRLGDRLLVDCH
jgi:D-inositol-3-phosphate glycosyltransferase